MQIKCLECGARVPEDLIRCPRCHAFIIDSSPWRRDHPIYAIPLAILLWLAIQWPIAHIETLGRIFGDFISQCILGLGGYGLIVLCGKYLAIRRQLKGFAIIRRFTSEKGQTEWDLGTARDSVQQKNIGSYNTLLAFQRLRWLAAAETTRTEDKPGLLAAFRQHNDTDWDSLNSAFSGIQFFIWLLPTAGFLGTVYGMTRALQHFSAVVASESDLSFTAGLTHTAQDLGIAFHTTLVGLACVIPLLALATICRREAQILLENMDKYFLRLASQKLYGMENHAIPPVRTETEILPPTTERAESPPDFTNSAEEIPVAPIESASAEEPQNPHAC